MYFTCPPMPFYCYNLILDSWSIISLWLLKNFYFFIHNLFKLSELCYSNHRINTIPQNEQFKLSLQGTASTYMFTTENIITDPPIQNLCKFCFLKYHLLLHLIHNCVFLFHINKFIHTAHYIHTYKQTYIHMSVHDNAFKLSMRERESQIKHILKIKKWRSTNCESSVSNECAESDTPVCIL